MIHTYEHVYVHILYVHTYMYVRILYVYICGGAPLLWQPTLSVEYVLRSCVAGLVYSGACLQQSLYLRTLLPCIVKVVLYSLAKHLSIQLCMQEMCSACVCYRDVATS